MRYATAKAFRTGAETRATHPDDEGHRRPFLAANSLEFAGVATAQLPIVSLEQHVAEKLHAYTGSYGQGARESTRVKDLIDLVLIGELAELDAERLSGALVTTFEQRADQPLPSAVPPPPSSWARQ